MPDIGRRPVEAGAALSGSAVCQRVPHWAPDEVCSLALKMEFLSAASLALRALEPKHKTQALLGAPG